MEEYKTLVFTRKNSAWGSAVRVQIELDGVPVGILKNGQTVTVFAAEGPHYLIFKEGKKPGCSVSIMVSPGDHTRYFDVGFTAMGGIVVTENGQDIINAPLTGKSRGAGSMAPWKVVVVVLALSVGICVGGPVLLNILDGDPPQASKPQESAPPSREDLAKAELDKVPQSFERGDYIEAIELCNEIYEKYPDTSIGASINGYLETKIQEFQHISAVNLMDHYVENVVNADERFSDQVLVINGEVASIAKTDFDTNLAVILKTDTLFSGVQLNFDVDYTEEVAALSVGDQITAIGECTGQDGTALLFLEGLNVMVRDCYILAD